ncbi:MAG: class I SAM-dependent methyltransferase [Pseudomonadales bacterium]|nr:class I SAM-dependent methyltransferase [Pseudomonadales bacterium]
MLNLIENLQQAWDSRQALFEQCEAEQTDCYRLFHGTVEGLSGVTVDRYGPQLLVQSFHESLDPAALQQIIDFYLPLFAHDLEWIYNDRSAANSRRKRQGEGKGESDETMCCKELDIKYRVSSRHAGEDPLLFLDLRVARRWLINNSQGKSVLNLFGYTCGAGVSAAKGGASEVWNVDFSKFALDFAQQNFQLNQIPESHYRLIESDCFAALKQLAGIPIKPRTKKLASGKRVPMALPDYPKLPQKTFDIVFLDPPKWAKSAFGTVDLVRDYQSLFKPALLTTKPNGVVIACNNVAKVDSEDWLRGLTRCAEKQQRPIQKIDVLIPDQDFPTLDGKPPLKIAVCQF